MAKKEKEEKQGFNEVIDSLNKTYGKGSVIEMSEKTSNDYDVVSTGSIAFDHSLGIGGWQPGKLYELMGWEGVGKTSVCGYAAAGFQKKFPDKKVVYIDAEHALDKNYFEVLGVDTEKMVICQPDYGEMGYNVAEKLIESGEVSLLIVDSNTAMIPKKVIDGEAGDNALGLQARLNSQMWPKIKNRIIKGNTCVIVTNQFREKIGVMFGCFHYKSKVVLADGTTEWIGKIVNNKMEVEVLSVVNGKIVPKKVIDWHKNGEAEKFWSMEVSYPHGKGRSNLRIADDHMIFTPTGERRFTELKVGDDVMVKSYKYLNEEQMQIIIGSMLGDGSIRLTSTKSTGSMRFKHAIGQNDYCKYKANILGRYFKGSDGIDNKGRYWWDSKPTSEIVELAKYKSKSALRFVDEDLLKQIDLRAIAIWYLDDGTFGGSYKKWGWGKSVIYARKLNEESKVLLDNRFFELGLPKPSHTKGGLMFSGEDSKLFQEKIAKFVPMCMGYKIHPKLHTGLGTDIHFDIHKDEMALIPAKISKIKELKKDKSTQKFDISVEEGECYFVDNTLVHNSPVTTNGGHALKFYSDCRIEISKSVDKEGKGNLTKIKVVKNKMAPPFVEGSFFIEWGIGISIAQELIDLGGEYGILRKYGNKVTLLEGEETKYELDEFIELLEDNEEFYQNLKTSILEKMKG